MDTSISRTESIENAQKDEGGETHNEKCVHHCVSKA